MFVENVQTPVEVRQIEKFIYKRMEGEFEGFEFGKNYVLSNGDVWQQTSSERGQNSGLHRRYRPWVLIYWTGIEYRMKVQGVGYYGTIATVSVVKVN